MVFTFEKFRPYLIGFHVIMFPYHTALKHLLLRRDDNPSFMLLLQKFDFEIRDSKDFENPITDHLSKIVYTGGTKASIFECFLDKQLLVV